MKKQPFVILSILLIFTVTGSIAFSAAESAGYSDIDKSSAAGYFLQIDHSIDCIAASSILQRNKLPCFFAYAAIQSSTALNFTKSHSSVINNDNTVIYKNNILLKLLT